MTATIPTRYGPLLVPDQGSDLIEAFLRRYGEWGWDEVGFLASLLPDGARVLDVGAYLGTFGLGLAARRRLGFLCAVEANPAVTPLLAANLHRAPCPALAVEAMVTGPGTLPRPGAMPPGNASGASFLPGGRGEAVPAPVRAATLAELCALHGPFNLVKLDAEGMEADILQADAEALSAGGTTLWVECNEDPRSLEVGRLLLSWGLELHLFAFPAHNPDNLHGDRTPIFPWSFEAGLLAAPRAPPRLDWVLRRHHCILRRIRTLDDLTDALWRIPRWGMAEWPTDDPAALAALAGRTLRNEARDTFLRSAAPLGSPGNEMIWQRLLAAEARAEAAEAQLKALGLPPPQT